jgi:hypothetical protein
VDRICEECQFGCEECECEGEGYSECLNCGVPWAECECDDWVREEALFRAERRDGIRDVDARLTPKGQRLYAEIDRRNLS